MAVTGSEGWGAQFIGGPLDGETYPLQFQFLSAAKLARYRWGQQMYRQTGVDRERQLFRYTWEWAEPWPQPPPKD